MNARDFVERIREEVIEQNSMHYISMLGMPASKVRDPRMRSIVVAFERMDAEQKEAVRALVRQVLLDTVSNLFGILDGSSLLKGFRKQFVLMYETSPEKMNGDLQEILLSIETDEGTDAKKK
jgi:hypothetical protein